MFKSILNALLGKAIPAAADFFIEKERLEQQVKLEKLKGKIAWEQALTRRASESEGRDHEWELERIRDSGYKDEWVLFLLSIPLILSFIPQTVVYVQMGFAALAQTPDWYRWLILLIFTAIYGIRIWRREIGGNSNKLQTN